MKPSKKFMLGTLFVAVISAWVAAPSLAANDTPHSPSPTIADHAAGAPAATAHVVGKPGQLKGVKPIQLPPVAMKPIPSGANNHENNAGCIPGGTGPSQDALCGN